MMGALEKSPTANNSMQRAKVYRWSDDGKWDDQGTGHVTVDYLERSEVLGLFVIDEEDNKTLLLHPIYSDDIYRKQEDTIFSLRDLDYSTMSLSFQETAGCSYMWDHIRNVQRNMQFSNLSKRSSCISETKRCLKANCPCEVCSRYCQLNLTTGRNEAIREETNFLSSSSQQLGVNETIPRERRETKVPVMVPNMDGLASMIDDDHQEQHGILNSSSQQIETTKTVRMKHRKFGIPISLEEIQQQFGKKLEDAAKNVGVSRSTMKRACREYGITWWRSGKRNKNPCTSYGGSIQDAAQDQIPSSSMPPTSDPPQQSPVAVDASRMKNIDIKVMYGDKSAIKFELSLSSGVIELQQQVINRLNGIDFENYSIQYKDEDNDWILIGCNEDLQCFLNCSIDSSKTSVMVYLKRFNMSI